MTTWPNKDPNEVLDYQIDWSSELGADTISTSTWTVPAGITEDSSSNTTTTATIWLSGGTAGETYVLKNVIVTAGGRTHEAQREISIVENGSGFGVALDATVGGASTDSYVTEAEYATYAGKRGWTVVSDTNQNLRRAFQWLNRKNWIGYKQYQTQTADWPRVTSELIDGWIIAVDTVPQDIKDAQCELAYLIGAGADPFATVTGGAVKITRAKAGPVETETEYANPRELPRYVAVDAMIRPYLRAGSGQILMGRG